MVDISIHTVMCKMEIVKKGTFENFQAEAACKQQVNNVTCENEGNFDTKLYTWLQQLGQSNYSRFCLSAVLVLRVVTPHLMAAREERRMGTLMGRKRGI